MYTRLLNAFGEFPNIKLTYDRGELEIMSPLPQHDGDSRLLGDLVVLLVEEFGLPLRRGGSFTIRRRAKLRGLEPDECFWIQNADRMAGPRRYNPKTDPPPDLALEVDVTSSSMNRMSIYRSLGVPEIWRLEDDVLTFHLLVNGGYQEIPSSVAIPLVTPADLLPTIQQARVVADEMPVFRALRQWARQRAAGQSTTP